MKRTIRNRTLLVKLSYGTTLGFIDYVSEFSGGIKMSAWYHVRDVEKVIAGMLQAINDGKSLLAVQILFNTSITTDERIYAVARVLQYESDIKYGASRNEFVEHLARLAKLGNIVEDKEDGT